MRHLIALVLVAGSLSCSSTGCKFFDGAGGYVASDEGQAKVEKVVDSALSGNWAGLIVGGVGLLVGAVGAGLGVKATKKAKAKK